MCKNMTSKQLLDALRKTEWFKRRQRDGQSTLDDFLKQTSKTNKVNS